MRLVLIMLSSSMTLEIVQVRDRAVIGCIGLIEFLKDWSDMSELPQIGNETILERFGEELGQWICQLKGLFLKKYSWDLVRSA